jgi:UDP-3-O-[3-hydroxymyristoyl] glucosamine N-acyltransferase
MTVTLGELAVRFGCALKGNPDLRVSHVASLEAADAAAVTFLANPRFRKYLATTKAGAVVLDARLADDCPVPALLAGNPYAIYARIAGLLHPAPEVVAGRHASATIDPTAIVDSSASIGPQAVIGARARIGARVSVGPGTVIAEDASVGADTRLAARVVLCRSVAIGERCILHSGAVIGADGFGFAPDQGRWIKVPQVGTVRIGDDVEIGANTTVDRGAINDTVIAEGVKLDNLIQIAHNVQIGAHTAIAACTGISGSAIIGSRCMIGGQVGIAGQLTICDDVIVTGRSFVSGNIRKPGSYSSEVSVDETVRFRKNAARFHQLDELARDVQRLRRGRRGELFSDGEPKEEQDE